MTTTRTARWAVLVAAGIMLAGCAKKLKAPEVGAPQQAPAAWKQVESTPTPVPPTEASTPAPAAPAQPCDEAKKLLEQAKADIAAATDVTPDLLEAQSLLDLAVKAASVAEAAMTAQKCDEVLSPAKEASVKAKEAQELALKMKGDQLTADCQAAEALIKQADADVAEAKAAGAEGWEPQLMAQAYAALAAAKAKFAEKKCVPASESAQEASVKAKAALAAKPAAKPAEQARYKVKRNDCLWDLSSKGSFFNDPWVWPLIYQANRDQITDPNLIFPGQLFLVPKDSSAEQVKEAVSQAQAAPWPRRRK